MFLIIERYSSKLLLVSNCCKTCQYLTRGHHGPDLNICQKHQFIIRLSDFNFRGVCDDYVYIDKNIGIKEIKENDTRNDLFGRSSCYNPNC